MNLGQSFDDFLKEQGDLEEVRRMKTSRAALNRLLDESDPSLTLTTLASVAVALESAVRIRIEPLQSEGRSGH